MTSGTCISTTRDPTTERIQNSLFCVVWSPASKSFQHLFLVPFTFTLPQVPRYSLTNCCRHEQQFVVAHSVEQRADDQQQQQRQRKKTQNKTKQNNNNNKNNKLGALFAPSSEIFSLHHAISYFLTRANGQWEIHGSL